MRALTTLGECVVHQCQRALEERLFPLDGHLPGRDSQR